jgi:hypothetical protein
MHPRLRLFAPVLLGVSLVSSVSSLAGVPSPGTSEVDARLFVCPYETTPFNVTVHDAAFNPVVNSFVELLFENCTADPEFPGSVPTHPCPTGGGPLTMYSDVSGQVTFMVKAGGVCPGSLARVRADGVILALRSVASPDQDGSQVVLGQDSAILVAKQMSGSFHATADLDGDGDTNNDQGDYAVYDLHAGHGCDAITPARPRSWGSVKLFYR